MVSRCSGSERVWGHTSKEVIHYPCMHFNLGRLWLKDRYTIAVGDLCHWNHCVRKRNGAQHNRAFIQKFLGKADSGLCVCTASCVSTSIILPLTPPLSFIICAMQRALCHSAYGVIITSHWHAKSYFDRINSQSRPCHGKTS